MAELRVRVRQLYLILVRVSSCRLRDHAAQRTRQREHRPRISLGSVKKAASKGIA
jgi:hypothetical protein